MAFRMDAGPRPGDKPKVEKKGTPAQREAKAQMHRWSRTNNATVRETGADGRTAV